MAIIRVNPNRMELMRLKDQLRTARRGHKLLKDKRDELMRQFLVLVRENQKLREQIEALLRRANSEMVLARAVTDDPIVETAMYFGRDDLMLDMKVMNVMSVHVPDFTHEESDEPLGRLPYGMSTVSGELDQAILALREAMPVMIQLANVEKKTQLMADEIERTRRRVNSLEYRMIPDLEDTIRSITMKMDENERGNLTRLMKVKDLILERELAPKQQNRE